MSHNPTEISKQTLGNVSNDTIREEDARPEWANSRTLLDEPAELIRNAESLRQFVQDVTGLFQTETSDEPSSSAA